MIFAAFRAAAASPQIYYADYHQRADFAADIFADASAPIFFATMPLFFFLYD